MIFDVFDQDSDEFLNKKELEKFLNLCIDYIIDVDGGEKMT